MGLGRSMTFGIPRSNIQPPWKLRSRLLLGRERNEMTGLEGALGRLLASGHLTHLKHLFPCTFLNSAHLQVRIGDGEYSEQVILATVTRKL